MKSGKSYFLISLTLIFFLSGCSTNKNTPVSRALLSLNTRFNVHFNGKVSYEEGLKAINEANKDDYGLIIPMYPVSKHENAAAATTQLNRTIEKCRKAIKTRSMKIKPKYSRRKASDPAYKAFMKQEEYNPFMPEVWMLLAKAEFHKADFLGAVGTFNYIARHFAENVDLGVSCQLWVIRSYAELGWIYEAEDLFSKLNQKMLKGDNVGLYAAVYADLLLKKHQYKEALPYLDMALKKEKDRKMKLRFSFLQAQLYQQTGDIRAAYKAYSELIKQNPPFAMAFNATINRAGLFIGNMQSTRKELHKMIRNYNHKDYLDQLYYTIGKSYLHEKDTAKALDYYRQAVESSTRNGVDKAVALIAMGDLYYEKQQYVKAQPAYDEASKIITVENQDYGRVSKRAELLAELVVQYDIVVLQDSLQRLSAMSEEDKMKNILAYIAKIEAEEKAAAERDAKLQEQAQLDENMAVNTISPTQIGPNSRNPQGEWYFYNTALIRSGQTEFTNKWGRRKLEDNWRRSNKSAVLFSDDNTGNMNAETQPIDSLASDSLNVPATDQLADYKQPEFYLKQIPVTKEQLAKSNDMWAEALFKMGQIYKDKLEDFPVSISTFDQYIRRFSQHQYVPEAYYQSYLMQIKRENKSEAERLRNSLIEQFPDSKYAQLLTNPNYVETKQQMFAEQDSLYRATYSAFNKSDFSGVFSNVAYVAETFPLTPLMPKFLFLKALSIGKTQDQETFETSLNELLQAYPESDVSSISKDILALIKQGKEARQGTTHGTILARREAELTGQMAGDSVVINFSPDKETVHRLMLVSSASEEALYELQFQLAVFNFSRFLLKDFELNISKIDGSRNALAIYTFENYEEVDWYLKSIGEAPEIAGLIKELKVFPVIISENNYSLIRSNMTLDDYLIFQSKEINEKVMEVEQQ